MSWQEKVPRSLPLTAKVERGLGFCQKRTLQSVFVTKAALEVSAVPYGACYGPHIRRIARKEISPSYLGKARFWCQDPTKKYQIFDFELVNSNSTLTFRYNLLAWSLAISSACLLRFLEPKMPYYGLTTRAQAVVMRALGTPLKAITQVTGISTKHISNLLKRAVENG